MAKTEKGHGIGVNDSTRAAIFMTLVMFWYFEFSKYNQDSRSII